MHRDLSDISLPAKAILFIKRISVHTPGVAEVDDEEPDHGYGGPASSAVIGPGTLVFGDDDGDDHVARDLCENSDFKSVQRGG